ncbi:hypothetical protein CAN33_0055060 [Aspergillus niger]|uniref:Uncharacterized protein n=3 Tax=Aspergillus niger TaxID=5061 RepID=A0A505I9Z3_ASPNG|nr:hypothetical protein CAN33_0055060 [Aspergillus niger]
MMESMDHPPIGTDSLTNPHTGASLESTQTTPVGPRSFALGLTRGYAADWTVPDALRELYQNWKDAILQTHSQISLLDFQPRCTVTDDQNEITFTVENPSAAPDPAGHPPVLGFIRFNVTQGRAEFANFGAALDEQCLELGHTTKKTGDGRLAGGHGEGLKLAALVLSRRNHHVKISANGCHWTFNFNGRAKANFYCRITPSKAKREPAATDSSAKPPRLSARVWEDVCVVVEKGPKGQQLAFTDFRAWLQHTVDLHPSSSRIRTAAGDLLLNPEYQDQVYLKGIRVSQRSLDPQPFRCGYVLAHGSVDRDRQRLLDPRQAQECIHSIWQHAIAQDAARVLPRYLALLRCHPLPADVRGAELLVTEATARRLWDLLQQDTEGANIFYCCQSRHHTESSLIRSELNKEPCALPDMLWGLLRRHGMVRDAMEELRHRLQTSKAVEVPPTVVAEGVARTLRALLALDASTARTQVVFVRCETQAVDLAYRADGDILYVHERWLQAPGTDGALDSVDTSDAGALLWPQIAEELYHRAITIMCSLTGKGVQRSGALLRSLLQQASRKLRQMPRLIRHGPTADGLWVSFYTGHSLAFVELCGAQIYYLVVLHQAICPAATRLLYDPSQDDCDCPRQVTPLSARTVLFPGLHGGSRILMVCRMEAAGEQAAIRNTSFRPRGEHGALIGTLPWAVPLPTSSAIDPEPANGCFGETRGYPDKPTRVETAHVSTNEPTEAPVEASVDQAVDQAVDKTVTEEVGRPTNVPVDTVDNVVDVPADVPTDVSVFVAAETPVDESVDDAVGISTDIPVIVSVDEASDKTSDEAGDEATDMPIHISNNEAIGVFNDMSTNVPIDVSLDEVVDVAVGAAADKAAAVSTSMPAGGSVDEPLKKPTSELVDKAIHEPAIEHTDKNVDKPADKSFSEFHLSALPPQIITPKKASVMLNECRDDLTNHSESSVSDTLHSPPIDQRWLDRNIVWWKDSQEQLHQQEAAHSRDHSPEISPQPRVSAHRFSKERFVKVRVRDHTNSSGESSRMVLYIHDIHERTPESNTGVQLVVTKYSFLADHPTLGAGGVGADDRELLLHWRDVRQIGQREDAEVIDADDVLMAETEDRDLAVCRAPSPPDIPAVGCFARFGIRSGGPPGSLFVTSLQADPAASYGLFQLPRLSPLPAGNVIDLTPNEVSLAAGFAQAGYRIRAAVGSDERCHQVEKEQYPSTDDHTGRPGSIPVPFSRAQTCLAEPGESDVPRIITIAGRARPLVTASGALDPWSDEWTSASAGASSVWQSCRQVAQSPVLSPDFIVGAVFGAGPRQSVTPAVGTAVRLLLEVGYSVTLRTVPIGPVAGSASSAALLLLAAPWGTNPQWIDETLADLQPTPVALGDSAALAIAATADGTGISDMATAAARENEPLVSDEVPVRPARAAASQVIEEPLATATERIDNQFVTVARNIATTITRIIGEFSKTAQPSTPYSHPGIPHAEPNRGKRARVDVEAFASATENGPVATH